MRRFLPYILIVFTLVNFLAPVGVGWGEKNLPKIETNTTEAAGCDILNVSFDPYVSSDTTIRPDVITLNIEVTSGCVGGIIRGSIYSNEKEIMNILATKITIEKFSYTIKTGEAYCDNNKLCKITTNLEADPANTPNESDTIKYNSGDGDKDSLLYKCVAETCNNDVWVVLSQTLTSPIVGDTGIKTYYYEIKNKDGVIIKTSGLTDQATCEVNKAKEDVGTTGNVVGLCVQTTVTQFTSDPINTQDADTMPDCSIIPMRMGGCFAQLIYYALFVPTSYLFALAGNFFDWTFAYSVNDASYRSGFVVQGWGVVRDFCNMFFIFILLYVAFTTILGTQDAKTKDMIVHVIIIGLLINFSLFATQVIIDASNILARVFYNSNTIVITPNGANGQIDNTAGGLGGATTPSDPTGTGIIPLSSALVNKINPQNLIINANDVGDFDKESKIGVAKNAATKQSLSAGKFIIVTLLAVGINIIGFLVFISVAMIFIARVIGLWIAMILSPMVFFTYMVPKLKNMEMIGWTKWWPETISLAFLAPVFVFFMYLILKFLETKIVFIDSTGKTGIQMVIATVVPFAFIMILLTKSKEIAKKMSGTMGQMITENLSKAGGLALGVATGGAAFAMRGTIGKYASGVANDEALKEKAKEKGFGGAIARAKLKTASYTSKASFDARNTQAGQQFSKQTGINMDNGSWVGMGKDRGKDGFRGIQEKKQKRDAENSENMKQSISAGADQDARAKAWNDDYMNHLLAARTSHEKSNPDEVFDEAKFKKDYEKGNAQYTNANGAQVTVGEKRVLNSDDTNRSRFTDRANEIEYGPNYIKNREVAKQAQGDSFNENDFKKTLTKSNLSERESALVKELRKKGTPEKTPLNVVEKENITKIVDKAKKAFEHANKELDLVNTGLEEISAEVHGRDGAGNLNVAIEDLTKKDTATYIDQKGFNDDISILETDISVLTARINKDPNAANIQTLKKELIIKNKEKKKVEREINKVTSLLSDQKIHQNTKKDSARTVNDNNEVLSRGYK